jgi:uncharacterized protein
MNTVKSVFWNRKETRIRSAFRMVIQLTAFFFLMKGLSSVFGIPSEVTLDTPLRMILAMSVVRLLRVVVSVWLVGRLLDRRSFSGFGIRLNARWWQDLGFGLGLGVLLMGTVFLIELAFGWIEVSEVLHIQDNGQSFLVLIIVYSVLFACVGFSEELMYRGYHLTNLAEGFRLGNLNPRYAIAIAVFLSSILFGVFHLGSPNATPLSIVILFLWGVLASVAYILTGNLAVSIGTHVTWNLSQGNVFGFPVSGTTFSSDAVAVFSIQQKGPDLWTGGVYGPEAGLLGLMAVIVGILLIVGWVRVRQGSIKQVQLAQPPAEK